MKAEKSVTQMPSAQPRIVHVIGSIAPYTHRLYEALGRRFPGTFHVLACGATEPSRSWIVPSAEHHIREIVPGLELHISELRSLYLNVRIFPALARIKPDIVFLGGFSPTMMLAAMYGAATGTVMGVSTDGVFETDPGLHSFLHRIPRHFIARRASFGFGPCDNSLRLLEHFGLRPGTGTVYPLVPAWDPVQPVKAYDERPFDLVFVGRLDERKGVPFLCDVLDALVAQGVRPRVRVAGEGPLRAMFEERLRQAGLEARFDGFVHTENLEEVFSSGRLFVFPSHFDPWGLVTNEALQCGTPVIGSPHATSVRELVAETGAGAMVPLVVSDWVEALRRHLAPEVWGRAQAEALRVAGQSAFDAKIDAMVERYHWALANRRA